MILYFSGTGNSRWAAHRLAESLEEQLICIPDVKDGDGRFALSEGERLGFVIPVHGWRPPLLVRRFLSRCQFAAPTPPYTYVVFTAGDNIGQAAGLLDKDLQGCGLKLDAAFSLIMPESYVGLPLMDVDTKERENQKKQQAAKDLEAFTDDIRHCRRGISKVTKGPLPWLLSGPVGGFFTRFLVSDKPFRVVSDRCVQCGVCAAVCPVHDIDGGKGKMPVWRHNSECLSCFSCYHHCPHHAIEYGCRTRNKGQYYYR